MNDVRLEARDLARSYGGRPAVAGVGFSIGGGEIFGLLGPNGAGKTTLLSMLSGLLAPDAGSVLLDGTDISAAPGRMKRACGIVPQEIALYQALTGRDNLLFFGRLYGLHGRRLARRVDEALSAVGLTERAGDAVRTYSGGMKRRLNFAAGLMHEPRILFLDEPTVGVDPQSRNAIFDNVRRLARGGAAVVYTTHYMEEAQSLCGRVAILDNGAVLALDTPQNLIDNRGRSIIHLGVGTADRDLAARIGSVPGVRSVRQVESMSGDRRQVFEIEAAQTEAAVSRILGLLAELDLPMTSLKVFEPNLESVFLHLTGKNLRD